MTSLQRIKRKNGAAWRIQFFVNGERKTLYLGVHYTRAHAVEIDAIVKKIVDATIAGVELDAASRAWLDRISDDLRERFERAGLLTKGANPTFIEIAREYLAQLAATRAPRTVETTKIVLDRFIAAAGNVHIKTLTKDELEIIKSRLDASGYAAATVAGTLRKTRTAINWAVAKGYVTSNPLDGFRVGSEKNKAREFFVDRETFARVLDAAPSPEARAVFALCRFGGLRRNEALALRWNDVDFEAGKIRVESPKTARAGKPERVVPLFPALRSELVRARQNADQAAVYIGGGLDINQARGALIHAIKAAGATCWPRLFQNLRASRSNEIYREFSAVDESAWIGHSERIARDHYLTVLDEDFQRALTFEDR